MKSHKIRRAGLALVLACFAFVSLPVPACTIFVLTDTNRALFCNNEDWSDPKTRIWFLPAGDGCFGAVYVGFDNGYAQSAREDARATATRSIIQSCAVSV